MLACGVISEVVLMRFAVIIVLMRLVVIIVLYSKCLASYSGATMRYYVGSTSFMAAGTCAAVTAIPEVRRSLSAPTNAISSHTP